MPTGWQSYVWKHILNSGLWCKGVLVVWKKTCLKGQLCSNIYSHITLTTSRFLLRFSKAGICEQWVSDLRPDMDSMQLRSQPYCSSSESIWLRRDDIILPTHEQRHGLLSHLHVLPATCRHSAVEASSKSWVSWTVVNCSHFKDFLRILYTIVFSLRTPKDDFFLIIVVQYAGLEYFTVRPDVML